MKVIFWNGLSSEKNVVFEWDWIFKTNSCGVQISTKTCIYSMLDNVKMWSGEATHLNTDLTESCLISVAQVHDILDNIQ